MRPFRVAAARRAGMPDARIRSREFAAPFHGVRAAHGVESDTEALARAYAVKMRRDAAFSHVTAAQLLGLPLPARFGPSPLHVSVPNGTGPVRGRGVVGHHLTPVGEPLDLGGLRIVSPVDVWLTLAGALAVPDLVAVGDSLVTPSRARTAWCGVAELAAGLRARPRVRGRRALDGALAFIRQGSASRPETLLRVLLVAAGFPDPVLNFKVPGLPYLIDIAWPELRFGIEYDGIHHRQAAQFSADVSRQESIHDEDWLLMRVLKEQLFRDPLGVVSRAGRRLAARGLIVPKREVSQMMLPRP